MPREGYTYEGIVVLATLCGAETWNMGATEKKRLNIEALRCLKSMCGITLINRVKNEELRSRTVVVRELADGAEHGVL